MKELFTVYLIALFLMLIVLIRMIRQINEKQREIRGQILLYRRRNQASALDWKPFIDDYEAELQRLKYYKTTAYIVAFTLTYCIIDCLLFNI